MSEFEEKVMGLLNQINEKLDKILGSKEPTTEPTEKAPIIEDKIIAKPSEVVEKQVQEEKNAILPPVEGRRVCPKCDGTAFTTLEDKNEVLHQMGGMKIYKKLYVCKICGTQVN
jgi:hypothetical protein